MKEGVIVLIKKNNVYKTNSINCDIYPNHKGMKIILSYLNEGISSVKDMINIYKQITKDEYNYNDEPLYKRYDLSKIKDIKSYFDYLYIINCENEDIQIDNVVIKKKALTICNYDNTTYINRKRKYEVILTNRDDIVLLENILDFYFRIFLGQYSHIAFETRLKAQNNYPEYQFMNFILSAIRYRIMPDLIKDLGIYLDGSYGIGNQEVDAKGKIAYEICKTIMHNRAYAEHPEGGMTVDFNEPLKVSEYDYPINLTTRIDGNIISRTLFFKHHLQIIYEAITIYEYFLYSDFRNMFSYFTTDEISLDLASVLSKYINNGYKTINKERIDKFEHMKAEMFKQLFNTK